MIEAFQQFAGLAESGDFIVECTVATAPKTSYTAPLDPAMVALLRALLERENFEFSPKPYAIFSASRGKVNVTVYEKGPKVLVQGKETEDFVRFYLEPEILGEAKLGYEEVHSPEMFEPHFGIDESGKGDFIGPLVIAGAYVDADITRALMDAGIQDSKKIGSDARIRKLAAIIRDTPGIATEVIRINPARYNELYSKFGNLNRMLAWGHAKVIENLHHKRPHCPRALSDQFAKPHEIERALKGKVTNLKLEQRTKAESDTAVAAASILARESFINWLRDEGEKLKCELPKGASDKVREIVTALIDAHGIGILQSLTKAHFKTSEFWQ